MARHDKGELGLPGGVAFDDGDQQRAGVEDGDQRGEPALVVVLRPVVAENGVGDVGLEDLRGPSLPFREQGGNGLLAAFKGVAAEEFGGIGRRAGARVEKRDADLAAGKRLVEHRQIADNERDKAEADA